MMRCHHVKCLVYSVLNCFLFCCRYSPHDVVVAAGSQAKGVHIVLTGGAVITHVGTGKNEQDSEEGGGSAGQVGENSPLPPMSPGSPDATSSAATSPEHDEKPSRRGTLRDQLMAQLSSRQSILNTSPVAVANITQSLGVGEVFGANGLLHKFTYSSTLSSGSGVCEILFLNR